MEEILYLFQIQPAFLKGTVKLCQIKISYVGGGKKEEISLAGGCKAAQLTVIFI